MSLPASSLPRVLRAASSTTPGAPGLPGLNSCVFALPFVPRQCGRRLQTPSPCLGGSIGTAGGSPRRSRLELCALANSHLERDFRSHAVSSEPASLLKPTSADVSGLPCVKEDFPILQQEAHGMPLVYLDSAATSQKPRQVLEAMDVYYTQQNANVHRAVHTLSALATEAYERAREKVAGFVNASRQDEIIFTRNASEAINLVAYSWGGANLRPGDEIVLTVAEHHSNLVPWQMVAQRTGAVLRFAELRPCPDGKGEEVNVEQLLDLISARTKLVAVHHVSNMLGSEIPVHDVVAKARQVGALVLLDACQSVPHMPVDVQQLGVDFAVASSHKMFGPTGIGFLYGSHSLLSSMPPFLGGGEMIQDVFLDHSTYAEPPSRFEAGTPAIAEAVGLGAACDYLQALGMEAVHARELDLSSYLYSSLADVPGVRVYGPPPRDSVTAPGRTAALCAFSVHGIHPTDLATFLDQQHGIAIRSGHHCAQPLHRALGVSSSARASMHIYNSREDVDLFIAALKDTIDFFSVGASP